MRKGDVLEEHDPNKALVGCYLDSFPRLLILVLAYCVGEKSNVGSLREVRMLTRRVGAGDYITLHLQRSVYSWDSIISKRLHRRREQGQVFLEVTGASMA
jgi:hypothetical protein